MTRLDCPASLACQRQISEVDQSDMRGNKRPQQVRAEPLALFALLSAVAGAVLALIGSAARRLTAITGGVGRDRPASIAAHAPDKLSDLT